MTAKLDGTNGLLQQYDYQTPTTGFSYTFAAGTTVLILQPAGTLATGTVTMPAAPADGMTISFSSTKTITALTVSPNTGQSIIGNPTTMLAGGAATFVYRLSNTTWYAQASTAAIGNTGAGAPVVTIFTSPSPWTKSPTLKAVKITMVGGGGSGAGIGPIVTPSPIVTHSGGAGGRGGFIQAYAQAPAIPGPVTITVGAGGTAPASGANAGNTGGTSSFGAVFTIAGGSGGGTAAPNPANPSGTPGASGGSFAITNTPNTSLLSVPGNAQQYGTPSSPASTPSPTGTPGPIGLGYGAGGGGGFTSSTSGNASGGAGTAGFVIVEEFY
jgi:hypothetical protein